MTAEQPSATEPDTARRLAAVTRRLHLACERAGVLPGDVRLVAVSKFHAPPVLADALETGHRHFGESRVQEVQSKWPPLRERYPGTRLHLIGPLQTNKAAAAVGAFDVLHSVDRPRLAAALATAMERTGRRPDCFVQVNTGDEAHKSGVPVAAAGAFVKECVGTYGLPVVGLMCIPPYGRDPRPQFALLRALAAECGLRQLSMGMSADFETAVAEGATTVRVGEAVFGPRPRH
ncbi:YggS family pyridoxal phosphate enzyme [Streptomyces sp. CB02923]|uniref:YggS family pyridoxal phosphate-dependent enzyme n=1 Tax=Streptomyces sp. CB02923 TaxID=1718985 RepID=UPI00093FC373|nr:YggS family pyridoxal phosphate-dependent enzyme [Streptomyces sp. CB02923]OKI05264.1 YggS family pyridoxal phosphate enzyme [Streptomyces sp. CB02923]